MNQPQMVPRSPGDESAPDGSQISGRFYTEYHKCLSWHFFYAQNHIVQYAQIRRFPFYLLLRPVLHLNIAQYVEIWYIIGGSRKQVLFMGGFDMREEIELQRNNVTPAQFLAYVRYQIKKHGFTCVDPDDINLDYWRRGNDLNFDIEHKESEMIGLHEKSISKPYQMQTYLNDSKGNVFNFICEFDFWDEEKGFGYFYLLSETAEETAEVEEEEEEEIEAEEAEVKTIPAIGDEVYTPRFCTVRISEVFRDEIEAYNQGFQEPTYYEGSFKVLGKSINLYRMKFCAVIPK